MSTPQLVIGLELTDVQRIEELLEDWGCLSTTLQNADDSSVFEVSPGQAPSWQSCILKALFDDQTDLIAVMMNLRARLPVSSTIELEKLEDRIWEREWMSHFQPIQFGPTFWVCPSWCKAPDPNATNLLLDPGLAFGTGTHATTALCLKWLAARDLNGRSFIDYGCGSGILAVAGALLGCGEVLAVDHEPQALLATRQNAIRNSIPDDLVQTFAPDQLLSHRVDLVVANILAQPLLDLAPELLSLVREEGDIVLSGVLVDQVDQILQAYRPQMALKEVTVEDDWACIWGVRAKD